MIPESIVATRKRAYLPMAAMQEGGSLEHLIFSGLLDCFRDGWSKEGVQRFIQSSRAFGDPRLDPEVADTLARLMSASSAVSGGLASSFHNWLAWARKPDSEVIPVVEDLRLAARGDAEAAFRLMLLADGAPLGSPESVLILGQVAMRSGENMARWAHLMVRAGASRDDLSTFLLGGVPRTDNGSWAQIRTFCALSMLWVTGGFVRPGDMLPWLNVCHTGPKNVFTLDRRYMAFWYNDFAVDAVTRFGHQDNLIPAAGLDVKTAPVWLVLDPAFHRMATVQGLSLPLPWEVGAEGIYYPGSKAVIAESEARRAAAPRIAAERIDARLAEIKGRQPWGRFLRATAEAFLNICKTFSSLLGFIGAKP